MKRAPVLLILSSILAAPSLSAQVARRPFLFKDGRVEVASARARGDSGVTVVAAAMPGANATLARIITALGGTIRYRDDDVDYIRAFVPVDSVERLEGDPALHSIDISKPQNLGRGGSGDGETVDTRSGTTRRVVQDTTAKEPWPPLLSDLPLRNRYSPIADIGAKAFLEQNPTFDGRGVTIAMIDHNPDMLLPELQVAMTLDGRPTPKIVVYQTAIDLDEQNDGRWLRMDETVTAAGGSFEFDSTTYTAPHNGTFRIAILDEASFDSVARGGLDGDVNRDENPEGSSRLFGVIWDEGSNDVWVDTDQDLSFTDEKRLTNYNDRREFGVFGTDNPETPVRESVGFGVQIDRDKKRVALNMGIDGHGSLVVGAAVASRGEKGRFDGVAPGARLASISESGASYGQTEAVIEALKNPIIDIAFLEQWSGITRSYLLRDGRLVPTVIYTRLIDKYKKPLLVPTHNYPILGAIDDLVLARGAIGVSGHESKDNFFANHGVRVEHQDNLLITGGYGPMGNGALKPDVISPSNYVSTSRGYLEGLRFATFQLPPGYTIAGGASTATPTAAGAVALLISAAKQEGVQYDAFRLKHAITRSARYVPHIPAYKQGNGVINVAYAWEILKALDRETEEIAITSSASVRTVYSDMLPTPNEGVGLYERDGWNVGDRDERAITFTRTSGPRGSMTFNVSWTGNDSVTYSAPSSLMLPLNTPVAMNIGVAPATAGVHTALLTLDHPSVPGYAYRMLTTVVAADRFTVADSFTVKKETKVPRPGMQSFFYRVDEGVTALKIDLSAPERQVGLAVIRPDTRSQRGVSSPGAAGESATNVVVDPMPGMWEIRLSDTYDTRTWDWEQAKEDDPVPPTSATLTVSALHTELTAANGGEAGDLMQPGSATYYLTLANRMASFTGNAVSTPVGSVRHERPTIRQNEQQVFEIEVPKGSPFLIVKARPSQQDADIDVYVYNCTEKRCRSGGGDADRIGDEFVMVRNPAAGTWKVFIDAPAVPSGSTTYEYMDVVFNPSYGMVALTDVSEERAFGAEWTATAHAWISDAEHATGRAPYTAVLIQGPGSLVVGLHELSVGVATDVQSNH